MGEEKGANGWTIIDQPRRRVRHKLRNRTMKQVRLIGKTKHGKDRIRQHGDVWNVLATPSPPARDRFVLESRGKTFTLGDTKIKDVRGVLPFDDPHFDIVVQDGDSPSMFLNR